MREKIKKSMWFFIVPDLFDRMPSLEFHNFDDPEKLNIIVPDAYVSFQQKITGI
jgi:hypothetical protein